uniref:Structural maintenance of chromosomes 1B n=1 Tax=Varanus komodoensis TaxID=61221 RepID=A0A8D2Q8F0_VARKO
MGYLKLLMMENFKSWRGRQYIGPFKKFTCVIGPNGSGKSNIMDALSFVMGEKASNLRVKHIQELIHGAHVGKPVSSSGSVRMVYSEENGEEKMFSRIIRGGGSEFLVNDIVVSRSVYIKELEDIGIIARARNCMVFQGEVEAIAMKKPKERTQLFEHISNSGALAVEYTEKKKDMHKAEENAQFSYNKKKNVAAERKNAKLEKEEAEHYQRLLEELHEYRRQLHLFQLHHNEQKINILNKKLSAKTMDIEAKQIALSHAEDAVKAKKKIIGILNRNHQHIEKEMKCLLKDSSFVLNQKRVQYIKAKEKTFHQTKKVDTVMKVLRNHMKEQAKQEENKKELEAELADINRAWRAFEKKVEAEMLHRESDVFLEENQIATYKELKKLVRKKVAILTQQLEKLQWEQKADEEKMSFHQQRQKETEVLTICSNLTGLLFFVYLFALSESLAEKTKEVAALTNELENSKIRIAEVNESLNKIVSDLHNAKIDVYEGKRQKRRAENLDSLKRLYPDYVFGRVVDLCHPIHKKYELAVTKIFGKYMTAIVVASEKAARDCIRFLKEERAEPETFLPLDYLEVEPINEQLREIKGSKMIIDVIQTSFLPLKKVILFICGNGLVCETVKEARQLAFDGPHRLKTVALDGTLFLKSGIISGGSSYLKMKAKYWEEKEVNELKGQREKLMNELKDLLKMKRKETDLKHLQTQCQGIQTRHKYSQNELEVLKKKHLANLYKEKSMLESELVNIKSQCAMLNEGVEDRVFHEFCEEIGVDNIRVYEKEHVQQQEEVDKKRSEFENQKTRLSVQLDYICSLIQMQVKKCNMLKESFCKDEADNILLKKVAVILQELVTLQKDAVAIETLLEQKKMERHNKLLDCKLQDLRINFLLGSLDDISEIKVYEHIMWHWVFIIHPFILASKENVLCRTPAPNLKAVERLQMVTGRFQESVDAFEACRREARLCRQEFEKVKNLRYDLFSQCFEHVSVAIDQIYKKLCRNSSAQAFLSPENAEEPYLEGIGYNCVAPGKRFMPMDNLSGGEKTVAALALVFAIHSFRPAPFFILDEVDAALDNTNIGKVSSFIRQQSQEKFQILVISLKEEFYSKADALVGVCPQVYITLVIPPAPFNEIGI